MAKLKLSYPEFRHAPAVVCGGGSLRSLADYVDEATVYLTSGRQPVLDLLGDALSRAHVELTPANHVAKPDGEPTEAAIRIGSEFLREKPVRRIVAVGGGSVLDWARLAWAHAAGALDLATGAVDPALAAQSRPQLCLVPTTCGTGAEAADVAVYQSSTGAKRAVVTRAFLADRVVLDGRFLESVAPRDLAAFLCDALSHSVEAYVSIVPLHLGKETAAAALTALIDAYALPPGGSRHDRLMEAGFLGGVAAANCSVGIVHAFAHAVGVDGMGHGLANGCALVTGLEFNAGTPQMQALLGRLRLDGVEDLVARVRPIVDEALESVAAHTVAARLAAESDYRRQIAARMAADVAIRSNPRRASEEDLLAFVDAVAARVAPG
ncbi:MAG TPA: iron-containing alcohol dehydrogenase [Gammaproteobacteria bacterium]